MEKKKILVCDDEEGVRESLGLILENDYDLLFASSGPEAIKKVREETPDAVFLDIKMPRMNGLETLKEIKKVAPDVKVIIATGYKSVEVAKEVIKHGALSYILKPFESEQVLSTLKRALNI